MCDSILLCVIPLMFFLFPVHEHPSCSFAPQSTVSGRIVLVGDAAHSLPPTGQGCNQALEDAAVLVDVLQHLGICDEALDVYSKQRHTRVKAILSGPADFNPLYTQPFLPAVLTLDGPVPTST